MKLSVPLPQVKSIVLAVIVRSSNIHAFSVLTSHRRLCLHTYKLSNMASQDPNPQGGSLTDMAVQGTKVPDDAGTQNTIPSVPRPDQLTDSSNDPNDLGANDLAGVADNAQDVSRVYNAPLPLPFSKYISITGHARVLD